MKLSRSAFIGGAVALGAECVMGANAAHGAGNAARLKVRFLGTGAADWNGRDARGELRPRKGQSVWLTHMARTLHGTQAELDKALPKPLKAAYDGLEIEL